MTPRDCLRAIVGRASPLKIHENPLSGAWVSTAPGRHALHPQPPLMSNQPTQGEVPPSRCGNAMRAAQRWRLAILEKSLMPPENEHSAQLLNRLIPTTMDSADGYELAAATGPATRASRPCSWRQRHGPSQADRGAQGRGSQLRRTARGGWFPAVPRAHRALLDLRDRISGPSDKAVIDEVERGEAISGEPIPPGGWPTPAYPARARVGGEGVWNHRGRSREPARPQGPASLAPHSGWASDLEPRLTTTGGDLNMARFKNEMTPMTPSSPSPATPV